MLSEGVTFRLSQNRLWPSQARTCRRCRSAPPGSVGCDGRTDARRDRPRDWSEGGSSVALSSRSSSLSQRARSRRERSMAAIAIRSWTSCISSIGSRYAMSERLTAKLKRQIKRPSCEPNDRSSELVPAFRVPARSRLTGSFRLSRLSRSRRRSRLQHGVIDFLEFHARSAHSDQGDERSQHFVAPSPIWLMRASRSIRLQRRSTKYAEPP